MQWVSFLSEVSQEPSDSVQSWCTARVAGTSVACQASVLVACDDYVSQVSLKNALSQITIISQQKNNLNQRLAVTVLF